MCLLNDALDRFTARKNKGSEEENGEAGAALETADTITVDDKGKVKKEITSRKPAQKKGRRKSRKSSLSTLKAEVKPEWEGKLKARLEMRVSDAGEEIDEATGKVIITDLDANGDGESENFKEELKCLCCRASLASTD